MDKFAVFLFFFLATIVFIGGMLSGVGYTNAKLNEAMREKSLIFCEESSALAFAAQSQYQQIDFNILEGFHVRESNFSSDE